MAAAGGGGGSSSLLGSATTWPLKRYGRFLPPAESDDEGQNTSSWKVFESNEESGHLILTIVVSGHFFISQGRAVLEDKSQGASVLRWYNTCAVYCWSTALRFLFDLATLNYFCLAIRNHPKEGFSLIDSHKWLKIVRRADCLLLRAHSKNECRLFRVQFGGDSKAQMLERCCTCVQKLAEYVPVQVTDEQSQQLYHTLHPLGNGENQEQDTEQNASVLLMPDEPLPDSCTSLGERRSVTQLAQCVLRRPAELSLAWQRAVWRAEELGPFIRLCLMDQNFPAFVEDVEKELRKLTEG